MAFDIQTEQKVFNIKVDKTYTKLRRVGFHFNDFLLFDIDQDSIWKPYLKDQKKFNISKQKVKDIRHVNGHEFHFVLYWDYVNFVYSGILWCFYLLYSIRLFLLVLIYFNHYFTFVLKNNIKKYKNSACKIVHQYSALPQKWQKNTTTILNGRSFSALVYHSNLHKITRFSKWIQGTPYWLYQLLNHTPLFIATPTRQHSYFLIFSEAIGHRLLQLVTCIQ